MAPETLPLPVSFEELMRRHEREIMRYLLRVLLVLRRLNERACARASSAGRLENPSPILARMV
jgi:hypothetical protein